MATQIKTVKIIPTWKAAASIYITAIVNGTPEGQRAGMAGVHEMAEHLDRINKENSDTDDS